MCEHWYLSLIKCALKAKKPITVCSNTKKSVLCFSSVINLQSSLKCVHANLHFSISPHPHFILSTQVKLQVTSAHQGTEGRVREEVQ